MSNVMTPAEVGEQEQSPYPPGLEKLGTFKDNLINLVVRDMVHPHLPKRLIEAFETRFWVGGYFCDGTTERRYIIYQAATEAFTHDPKSFAETIESLEFELDLQPSGGILQEQDVRYLYSAWDVKALDANGEPVTGYDVKIEFENAKPAPWGYIKAPEGVVLSKLIVTFKLEVETNRKQESDGSFNRYTNVYFKRRKK